ncbi:MAG: class I SAM-dependent methyltransferase [Deltaproteobacteria bacterium]|nr:class I SAM-dependent methyltransferase [Deltaproteobacteria bacterium]
MSERLDIKNLDQLDPAYRGHRFRYHLARGFILPSDDVVDVCCGMGYGAEVLGPFKDGHYMGFDHNAEALMHASTTFGDEKHRFYNKSFEDFDPKEFYHVALAFECLEHLEQPLKETIAKLKLFTKRLIICSVPLVPSKEDNEFHLRDITHQEMCDVLIDDEWKVYESCLQRDTYGVYIAYNTKYTLPPSL